VYTVQSGDTLSKIAARFGLKANGDVAPWDLLVHSNRPDIVNADDFIQPGQKLRVPSQNGILHVVISGESTAALAKAYGVAPKDLMNASSQAIGEGGSLQPGQEVLIANPQKLAPVRTGTAPDAAPPETTATPVPTATATPSPTATPEPAAAAAPAVVQTQPPAPPTATRTPPTATPTASRALSAATATPRPTSTRRTGFSWPTAGPISSYFGANHPLGIDIDLFNNQSATISAAAAGKVTFAGGNSCCSYGLYVIIDHGNGYTTLYAHLSKVSVSTGQSVSAGQAIGTGGRTGYATGVHLHFEARYNDAVIDPLSILP
jgi:murein DD-endopeptidase MepM/ murein hydrolase activator NlpD